MKKKGFTLIELLAVIVILAIIALIATPMILGVIKSAKKGAAESSAVGYIQAVEQVNIESNLYGYEGLLLPGPMNIVGLSEYIQVKGDLPSKGTLILNGKKEITGATLCINGFYVVYDGKKATVDDTQTCQDILSPGDLFEVEVKPGTKYRFRIIKDYGDGTVDAIMTSNLEENVVWLSSSDLTVNEENKTMSGPVTLLDKLAILTADWTNVESFDSSYDYSAFYNHQGDQYRYDISYTGKKARLLNGNDIQSIKGSIININDLIFTSVPDWLGENTYKDGEAFSYWMADASLSAWGSAAAIYYDWNYYSIYEIAQYDRETNSGVGVRPVIHVKKENLIPVE